MPARAVFRAQFVFDQPRDTFFVETVIHQFINFSNATLNNWISIFFFPRCKRKAVEVVETVAIKKKKTEQFYCRLWCCRT